MKKESFLRTTGKAILLFLSLFPTIDSYAQSRKPEIRDLLANSVLDISPHITDKQLLDVYSRLMQYQTAGQTLISADIGIKSKLEDYLTIAVNNLRPGDNSELNQNIANVFAQRSERFLDIQREELCRADGSCNIAYYAAWIDQKISPVVPENFTLKDIDKYTTYDVTVNFKGESLSHKGIIIHCRQNQDDLDYIIIDGLIPNINSVAPDRLPTVKKPRSQYIEQRIQSTGRNKKGKINKTSNDISDDAPIGFIPEDGEEAASRSVGSKEIRIKGGAKSTLGAIKALTVPNSVPQCSSVTYCNCIQAGYSQNYCTQKFGSATYCTYCECRKTQGQTEESCQQEFPGITFCAEVDCSIVNVVIEPLQSSIENYSGTIYYHAYAKDKNNQNLTSNISWSWEKQGDNVGAELIGQGGQRSISPTHAGQATVTATATEPREECQAVSSNPASLTVTGLSDWILTIDPIQGEVHPNSPIWLYASAKTLNGADIPVSNIGNWNWTANAGIIYYYNSNMAYYYPPASNDLVTLGACIVENCKYATLPISLTCETPPSITINGPTQVIPNTGPHQYTSSNPNVTWALSDTSYGSISNCSGSNCYFNSGGAPGSIALSATYNSSLGCPSSAGQIGITILENLIVQVSGRDEVIANTNGEYYTATVSNPTVPGSFQWSLSNSYAGTLSGCNGSSTCLFKPGSPNQSTVITASFTPSSGVYANSPGVKSVSIKSNKTLVNCGVGKCEPHKFVGSPVNVTNGNMFVQHADYSANGLANELNIIRTYNSQNEQIGMFGLGWSTPLEEYLEVLSPLMISLKMGDGRMVYFSRNSTAESIFTAYEPKDIESKITLNSDNTYSLEIKPGGRRVYNSSGKLSAIYDRNGNVTTFNFNGNQLASISSFGRTLTFSYDAHERVSSIDDGLGQDLTYVYNDANGALIQANTTGAQYVYSYELNAGTSKYYMTMVTNGGVVEETHQYDNQGRAITSEKAGGVEKLTIEYLSETETRITDAINRVTVFTIDKTQGRNLVTQVEGSYSCEQSRSIRQWYYDSNLNLTSTIDKRNYGTTYAYDSNGNVTSLTTPTGTTTFTYNSIGQELTRVDSMGGVANVYDPQGNLSSSTDSTGAVVSFTYDSRGFPLTKTDPLGHVAHYTYDLTYGDLTSSADALNQTTYYTYDTRRRLAGIQNPMGYVTQFGYDSSDRLISTTFPNGSSVSQSYDSLGRLTSKTDANGNTTTYSYDSASRLIGITDATGTTTMTYDLMSRKLTSTDPLGRTIDYAYNDMDKVIKITYPEATPGAGRLDEHFEYDATGNLIEKKDTADNVKSYQYDGGSRLVYSSDAGSMGYDAHGNPTSVSDAAGNSYAFTYDYNNLLKLITRSPGSKTMQYWHDLAGNVTQRRDYNGALTTYTYDVLNRLTGISYPNGQSASFTYDALSRMIAATNANGTVTLGYDSRNRVTSVTDVWGKQITFGFDGNGNRTSRSLDGYSIAYGYNALDELTNVYDNSGNSADFTYDQVGRLTIKKINNLLISNYSRNNLDQLTGLNYTVVAETLANFEYGYTAAGQIGHIDDRNGTHNYSYDGKNQLVSALHSAFASESYSYDGIGNHQNPPPGVSFQFDLNGNTISKTVSGEGAWQYSYDYENRLTTVTRPDGQTVNYAYDALGRRVSRTFGTQRTRFVYDGDNVALDINENWNGSAYVVDSEIKYVDAGIDYKLWYKPSTGNAVLFLNDHLGSTRALVSNTGTIVPGSQIDYDSFGNSTGSVATRYRYTGREWDPDAQLYYYRARYYDPAARRFISEDPIGLAGGINLYAYVGNNPVNLVDPLGLEENSIPVGAGMASVVRIPIPGANLFVSLNPENYKGKSTSTLFFQTETGSPNLRLDYGFNVKTGNIDYHWNQKGTFDTFGISNHAPAGQGGKILYNCAKYFKYAGKTMIVLGAGMDAYSIYAAEDRIKQSVKVGAGWLGAWGGAKGIGALGAGIGTAIEPGLGTGIGAVAGGIIGGAGGYFGASWAAGKVYEKYFVEVPASK